MEPEELKLWEVTVRHSHLITEERILVHAANDDDALIEAGRELEKCGYAQGLVFVSIDEQIREEEQS